MKNKDYHYIVTIKLNNKTPFTLVVNEKLTIGRDPRCDVILTDKNAPEKLFEINEKDESLYLKYLGPKRYGHLNSLTLENGQNYFLDIGDRIKAKNNIVEVTEKKLSSAPSYSNQSTQLLKERGFILDESDEDESGIENVPLNNKISESSAPKNYISTYSAPKSKEYQKTENKKNKKSESVNFKELLPLKFYAFITDFFLCYLLVAIALPKFVPIKFFSETAEYLLNLIGIESHSSFLSFIIFLFLFNFGQCLIFGSTLGQFLVGLRMDTQNKFSRMLLLRMKTFFYSLVLIPAQNSKRQGLFFKISRFVFVPLILALILASPFLIYPVTTAQVNKTSIAPGANTISFQNALQTHQFLLQKTPTTIIRSTIENRYYPVMVFGEGPRKPSSLRFIDLIEDQNINIHLVRSFNYSDLNDILSLGNPFFEKTLDSLKLKEHFIYAMSFSPESYLAGLLTHGPFTGAANEVKKLFIPKGHQNTLMIHSYSTPSSLVSYDTNEFRYYFIFDQTELYILKAPTKNSSILKTFEEQVFGNLTKDNLFTEEEETTTGPKELTLLELFKVNTSQNTSEVLTYYINAVNKVLNTDVVFGKEKLNLDIKYLLVKSIESTLEVTKVYKDKLPLQTLIQKLTPMETPGEIDE